MSAPTEKPREHKEGHAIWTQAGPGGKYAHGCQVPGCRWPRDDPAADPAADVHKRHPTIPQDPIPDLEP
jgi:hypothetical protein